MRDIKERLAGELLMEERLHAHAPCSVRHATDETHILSTRDAPIIGHKSVSVDKSIFFTLLILHDSLKTVDDQGRYILFIKR